jgi:hypothetical protein
MRCESCLDVLTLRHAWDLATCSCGALMMSGRPTKPVVHWLSRPGGGWTELDEVEAEPEEEAAGKESAPEESAGESKQEAPPRRLGFGRRSARIPTTAAH